MNGMMDGRGQGSDESLFWREWLAGKVLPARSMPSGCEGEAVGCEGPWSYGLGVKSWAGEGLWYGNHHRPCLATQDWDGLGENGVLGDGKKRGKGMGVAKGKRRRSARGSRPMTGSLTSPRLSFRYTAIYIYHVI